ncbi:MAG: S9 family peptidase [Gemmatimonadaceae bacterium]|nr:S9 family peptidase [Gemmatimonadaceae bacterium]NUQ92369.1 S9 family peptidase [Gemmatimonadaceae bacterium]NUR20368.1 S9 family peptidase [Gemmatimonadaceae bacterium]
MSRRPALAAALAPLMLLVAPACAAQRATVPAATPAAPIAGRPITFEDFATMPGVSDPQLSPDGTQLLYAVRTTDIAANRRTTRTFVIAVAGGSPRQFPDASTNASEARWSPDGKQVAFTTGGQIWVADASGGQKRQLTNINAGASGPVWAPTGDRIAFTTAVYPDCADEACNVGRATAADTNKVKAHIADNLLYRHWTAYSDGTRSHLYVVAVSGGMPADLTAHANYDVPPPPFGGSEAYAWSPDGREITYSAKDQGRADAWTTDINLYTVTADASAPAQVITASNRGADQNPVYSPDGRYIAYQSQARGGFESDRQRLMLYDRAAKTSRELLPSWDRNADSYFFAPDSRAIYVATTDHSRDKLYRVALGANGAAAGAPSLVVGDRNNVAFNLSRDGRTLAWQRDAADRPTEIWVARMGKKGWDTPRQLTHETDAKVAALALHPAEEFWYAGAGGDSVQGFVVRPPQFQAGKKYPMVLLIHGGPQGAWLDNWHGRWNYQMFASPGEVVVFVNPRGSTGYGQRFVDEVSKDWGGKAYEDIMKGVDAAVTKYPFIDSTRMAAAGGSYGGYMANWINGHTDRFKAIVSHAGVFNLESMAGATEELWFTDWEFGGQWWDSTASAQQYRKWSPHLYAGNMKTPTLVIDGELDYRVPYTEGLSLFTALQRRGVPSRLVIFPDEGHWIGKPQNQRLWWSEVNSWIARFTNPVI